MMFHNSLAVCVLAVFVVTLQVSAQQGSPQPGNVQPISGQPGNNKVVHVGQNVNVERQLPQVIVARILARLFAKAAKNCLDAASNECRGHWNNPGEAIKCGTAYLQRNRGRCVIGG